MRSPFAGTLLLFFLIAGPISADPLPRVEEAAWPAVRDRCRQVLAMLRKENTLPVEIERKLAALLAEDGENDRGLEQLQDLLDPLCLIGVHINPESRVKAARGPGESELTRDRPRLVLIKVHNEGGITAPLAVTGDELRMAGKSGEGRWLEAKVLAPPPGRLSGARLEYVALRLTAREAGKREATLRFDAGQGTQDLGFRADVPILFRVRERP
jgi:hypothetical protein